MIKPTMNRIAGLIQLRLREDLEGDGEGEGKSGCCSSDIVTIRKVGERIALFYRQEKANCRYFFCLVSLASFVALGLAHQSRHNHNHRGTRDWIDSL